MQKRLVPFLFEVISGEGLSVNQDMNLVTFGFERDFGGASLGRLIATDFRLRSRIRTPQQQTS